MEIASSCVLHSLGFCSAKSRHHHGRRSFLPSQRPPPFSIFLPNPPGRRFDRLVAASSSCSSLRNDDACQKFAVLLEVEGVLMDVHRVANREAFNLAFQKLALDCANWTEPIYVDLLRRSSGDEESMLILYFNRIGWPSSLPTSEKGAFAKSVLREKKYALDEIVKTKSLHLRPGVEDFIDDACNEGIPVVLLTTYNKSGDKVARSIIEKLGNDRISKLKIVGNEEIEQSFVGQLIHGKRMPSGVDEQLAKEAREAASAEKCRIAAEVSSLLKLIVDIDTSSAESLQKILAALRVGAELAGVPFFNCVLIAGSQSGAAGAGRIGMPCFVLRSSLTSRAEFPSATAVMDGFGGADLTIRRLHQKYWS